MSSDWREGPLDECVVFQSGSTPFKGNPEFWIGKIPWISAKDMKSFWIDDSEDHLSEAGAAKASRVVDAGTTLMLTRGMTLHNDVPIVRTRTAAAFNQDVKAVLPRACLVSDFVPYLLLGNKARLQSLVDSAGHGTGRLNTDSLKALSVKVPPKHTQIELANFFSALDDRIALLRETNATLEAIAQALFKSWFVDFDPVRAKQEGREPEGMDAATAALFPCSFEESGLGLVPEGWSCGKVEDLLELAYGKALKASDRTDGPVPVYGSGGITGWHVDPLVVGPSIIVGRKGTVGSLYWEDRPFYPIDTVFYVKTSEPMTFCYYLLKTLGLEEMNTDGAVPGLNRGNAYRLQVIIPPTKLLNAFDAIASILRARIFLNEEQVRALAAIRDSLLPRLISGQLRLPDFEPAKG